MEFEFNNVNNDKIKCVNVFAFILKLLTTLSINNTLHHFGQNYYVNFFFFRLVKLSDKNHQKKVLSSSPKLMFFNNLFNASHGLRYTINNFDSNHPLWRIIHSSVHDAIKKTNGSAVVPNIMTQTFQKAVFKKTGKRIEFKSFIEDTTFEWFGHYMLGDHQLFRELHNELLDILNYTFYNNPFRRVPFIGTITSRIRRFFVQNRIDNLRKTISKCIGLNTINTSFFSVLCEHLRDKIKEYNETTDLSDDIIHDIFIHDICIDNIIIGLLLFDFVNFVLTGALYKKITTTTNIDENDITDIIKDNFLFEFRGRVMSKNVEFFKKSDIILLNLVDSELIFSYGERSCPGQVIVRPLLKTFIDMINKYEFYVLNRDYRITRKSRC